MPAGGGDDGAARAEAAHARPRAMYLIKQLESAVRRALDEVLRPLGLTTPQYTALTTLRVRPGMSQADLARFSFVSPQSVGEIVAALTKRGFVQRRPSSVHRRRFALTLTERGEGFLQETERAVEAIEAALLGGLRDGEAATLIDLLRSCRTEMRGHLE